MKLSLWKRIQLKLFGYAFLRYEKRPGWKGYLPIYVVKCPKHGLYTDYPHGYTGYFTCPKCKLEETQLKEADKP